MDTSDEDIVRRVQGGDVEAFGQLVERHWPRCWRYAMHTLGSREEAEEAVQDSFVRACGAIARCTEPSGFRLWLFTILVNRCRTSGARSSRRARLFVSEADVETDVVDLPGDDPATASALRAELAWALGQLPEGLREAFLLKHVEELEYEEMAKLTGAGVSALKMRVKRACERLRELLTEVPRA